MASVIAPAGSITHAVRGGASFRSLEQERVKAVGDACPTLGWVQHGPVDRGASPARVTGLMPGYCYRWRLDLSDSRDNLSTELSGVVRVAAPAP